MNRRNPKVHIIANGNIYNRDCVQHVSQMCASCIGIMSAEGILRDPAIFTQLRDCPDRNELFQEYCDLSEKYLEAGAWTSAQRQFPAEKGSIQIFIARQHLAWMLEKSGHGRSGNPNLTQVNPNLMQLYPNLSQLHPNLTQLHPNLTQLNPNLTQLNPSSIRPPWQWGRVQKAHPAALCSQ